MESWCQTMSSHFRKWSDTLSDYFLSYRYICLWPYSIHQAQLDCIHLYSSPDLSSMVGWFLMSLLTTNTSATPPSLLPLSYLASTESSTITLLTAWTSFNSYLHVYGGLPATQHPNSLWIGYWTWVIYKITVHMAKMKMHCTSPWLRGCGRHYAFHLSGVS